MSNVAVLRNARKLGENETKLYSEIAAQAQKLLPLLTSGQVVRKNIYVQNEVIFVKVGSQFIAVNPDGEIGMSETVESSNVNYQVVLMNHLKQLHQFFSILLRNN